MNGPLPGSPSRSHQEITDYQLELPAWSYSNLKAAAEQLCLARPHSLSWAILLNVLPPPDTNIVKSIKSHRNLYNDLISRLSRDPRTAVDDDPLSQKDESAWKQHFCDNELKALILQDVVRTFPDELYFRDKDVQNLMVRVLFYWARTRPYIGYRQGMHEILALLLFELHLDRMLAPSSLSDTLKYYLDEDYLEHDSYMLFSAVIHGLERFYTTGDAVPSPGGRMPRSTTVHNPNEVVRYLEHVKNEYLSPADPELTMFLDQNNITMELFGIRWLRLLFGREFSRAEIPKLWGFIFANGPSLPYLHYIIVAMLLSIRDVLLNYGSGMALSTLMRGLSAPASHICALALHLRCPDLYPQPQRITQQYNEISPTYSSQNFQSSQISQNSLSEGSWTEGVAEGADVARELATLAVLRARLPTAAKELARNNRDEKLVPHLDTILQLAALLQCRNHALIDVETALEAAEASTQSNSDKIGRKMIVPVALPPKTKHKDTPNKQLVKVKEVPLKLFHQAECVRVKSDFPCLDPLKLRTE